MQNPIIILEIPHQYQPKAWTAWGWDDAAARSAARGSGETPGLIHWTRAGAIDCWGDWDDVPADLRALIEAHGAGVEVNRRPGCYEYVAPSGAPTLAAVVQEWIRHDLHTAWFLEGPEDVQRFLDTYDGHQRHAAKAAVEREANVLGWLADSQSEVA